MGYERRNRRGVWATCWLLIFGLGDFSSLSARADSLFTRGSTVVLVSGIPGDVESENDYGDLLKGWLEVVQGSGSVRRLFILCDTPNSVALSPGIESKVLKASRESWLWLASTLKEETKSQTNSLVVIVWGHGGRQGQQPVFHVRGPRLTPADFKTLAEAGGASRWVLMFRGSGAFAREIVSVASSSNGNESGGHPLVISSDADQMFGSDPIGSGVLLQIVRRRGEISMDDLSQEYGQAAENWYEERHLARVEEPAFWRGGGQPQLMAQDATRVMASVFPSAEARSHQDTRTNPEAPPPALGPAWNNVKRTDSSKYSYADAVILRRQVQYTIGAQPALENEVEEFIQILKPEGKHLGDFDLSYSPPEEDLDILDCEVLTGDGKLMRLEADAIREASGEMQGDYQHARRKFFSLPGVVPGAVVHVRFQTRWKRFPLPHVSLEIPLARHEPIMQTSIEINVPKGDAFHFAVEHAPEATNSEPEIIQQTYGTQYRWNFRDIGSEAHEILAPPHTGPRLLVSTFPDWQTFAEWYGRISQLTDEVTPEISAKAAELTKGADSEREKLVALYNYVTSLRYVAIPLGVNSFRPHAAANVLKNQFGDCKDKANLLNALLHSLNMEAQLVLVPRFSQAYDTLPGLAFNHAISKVTMSGETVWVDTTDDVCRFGMLPPGDPGRKVLVIHTNVAGLTQLPQPQVAQHWLKIRGDLDCRLLTNALNEGVPAKLSLTASGFPDYLLRQTAQDLRGQTGASLLGMKFAPLCGVFAANSESASAISALEQDFSWKGDGTWIGLVTGVDTNATARAPIWLPKEWELALHARKQPLLLNEGYPLRLEEEFDIALPVQANPSGLCPPMESTGTPLRWRVEWTRVSDDKLFVRLQAELAKGELSEVETQAFQQQLRGLLSAASQEVKVSNARVGRGPPKP